MSSSSSSSSGIGFTGLLTIAFIVLKLTKVIDWAWIWVLSPLWIGFILVILIFCGLFFIVTKKPKRTPMIKSKWEQRLEELRNKNK